MKLQVTQENLAKALSTVARVASGRATLPILSNVLIKTVGNRLSISATNLDIATTHYIGSKVAQEGAITVPARLMQDFVSSLPSGVIKLNLEENKLHITAEKYESTINGVSAEDFPVMPSIETSEEWKITGSSLKTALQQVVLAASSDEARPILTGVYFHTKDGHLYMAATDSYRLAQKRLMPTKKNINLLIPASAMQDLLRIIGDYTDDIVVKHDDQQVLFVAGDIQLVARLIEGTYPDYHKLIPEKFTTTAVLERSELVNITKVSSLFARESAGSVTINVDKQEQQVSIRAVASQLGENVSNANAKVSDDGATTLNSRYLLDGLNALLGETVSFAFNGKLDPCVLRDPSKDDYLHLVMPLKS